MLLNVTPNLHTHSQETLSNKYTLAFVPHVTPTLSYIAPGTALKYMIYKGETSPHFFKFSM